MPDPSALRRRLRAIDPVRFDIALAGLLATAALWDWHYSSDPTWRLPFQLLITTSVAIRRSHPVVAFAAAVIGALALGVSPGAEGNAAILIDAYSVGRHASRLWRSSVALVVIAAVLGTTTISGTASLVIVIAALIGVLVREQVSAATARADSLVAAERGATEERARIARDLHDIVAHAVSVIVVQAEAAKNMLHREPARASESIDAIAASGREALLELRQLLRVLGSASEGASLSPSPVASDIDQLVERVRSTGQQVDLRVEGEPRVLEPGVSQTAYRIVQEALTNAVRYAEGARTEVVIAYMPDRLTIEVVDAGGRNGSAGAGSGRGLAGLRERVAIFGGEISTSSTTDGGFAVRASLPAGH